MVSNKTFKKHMFFGQEGLEDLWKVYHATGMKKAHQDYSLHHVEKRVLKKEQIEAECFKNMLDHYHSIGYAHLSSYFLLYPKYSWTRPHHDDIGHHTQTCITLLEEKDLEGGETLVWDTHYDLPTPEDSYVVKTGSVHRKNEIVCTPTLEPGESLSYGDNVKHGVAQVRAGHRIVLVSWFRRK